MSFMFRWSGIVRGVLVNISLNLCGLEIAMVTLS